MTWNPIRARRLPAVVAGLLVLCLLALAWPTDFRCDRCGAIRHGVILRSVQPTDSTRWLQGMGYGPCPHHWILNSAAGGTADCFADLRVPVNVLKWGGGARTVVSVPDEATRRQIVAAVTDHRNKLRWAAVVALNASWASKDRTPEEWPAWEERYRAAFRPQRDAAKARETARRILQYVKEDYEEPGLSLAFSALERELGVK